MTDLWNGALIDAAIWHGRSGDLNRQFRYRATYAALPLDALETGRMPLSPDRGGIWSLRRSDYGKRDGSSLQAFIAEILRPHDLDHCRVILVTMPRGVGYGFNPVSFWLARDEAGLRAVLAEVSNTFGEKHLYLCRHPNNRVIDKADRFEGEKLFHVSPFLPREGSYQFRFDPGPGRFGAWVDWSGADGSVRLGTSMAGSARPLTRASLRAAALRQPIQPLKVIGLIHWQALKLKARGGRYRPKPRLLAPASSEARSTERHDG